MATRSIHARVGILERRRPRPPGRCRGCGRPPAPPGREPRPQCIDLRDGPPPPPSPWCGCGVLAVVLG